MAPASRAPSDDDVLAAFERHEPARAELLYDHLIGAVEATLFRVLGKRDEDYDDLVQSAFEQILKTLRRKRYARACSLRSWAASIACHVALNALRGRGTQRKYFEREQELELRLQTVAGADNPERNAGLGRDLDQLRGELARMSPDRARTLLLHDAFGYELAEIAVLTNTSVAATQSRLVRGRKELRQRLEAAGLRGEGAS